MRVCQLLFFTFRTVAICFPQLAHLWTHDDPGNDLPMPRIVLLIAVFIGIATLGFAAITPMMWTQARRTDREIDSVRCGHFFDRWEYRREFWQAWIKQQNAPLGNSVGVMLMVLLAAIPIAMVHIHNGFDV